MPWVHARDFRRFALFVLLCLGLSPRARADCIRFEDHAGWIGAISNPNGIYGIAAQPPYLYAAAGEQGLVVYDIRDPAHPQPYGALNLFGFANDVALLRPDRLVVELGSELCLIDISVLASPRLIDRVRLGRSLNQMALDGWTIYVAGNEEGLLSARWTEDDRLVPASPLAIDGRAVGIAIEGHVAYVAAASSGLVVVNLVAETGPRVIARRSGEGDANGIGCDEHAAVISDSEAGLVLLDVTDPAHPALRASHEGGASFPSRPLLFDRQVFAPEDGNQLRVFDTGMLNRLQPQGSLSGGGSARCVSIVGGVLYYGDAAGLWIASAEERFDLAPTSTMRPRAEPNAIAVSGHLFALAEPNLGVELLEIDAGGLLTRQTWFDELDHPTDVALRPPFAFVATRSEGVVSLDLRNYLDPKALSRGEGRVDQIELWGNRLVAISGRFQAMYDVSDPVRPARLGFRESESPAYQALLSKDGLVVLVESNKLEVLDWSSGEAPVLLSSIPGGEIGTAAFYGEHELLYAEAADEDGPTTLSRFDLSSPSQPRAEWSLELPARVDRIESAPPYAYLSSVENGVTLLDLSDPNHPLRAGSLNQRGIVAATSEDNLVLASADSISVIAGECGAVAPVALANLRASADVGRIRIEWDADAGLFDHFEIERAPVLAIGQPEFVRLLPEIKGDAGYRYDDLSVQPQVGYQYRVIGVTALRELYPLGPIAAESPDANEVTLFAPFPTPARDEVALRYYLPRRGPIELAIFDPAGRTIRSWSIANAAPGGGVFRWNGDDEDGRAVPAGLYFARFDTGRTIGTQRVVWLR